MTLHQYISRLKMLNLVYLNNYTSIQNIISNISFFEFSTVSSWINDILKIEELQNTIHNI